MQWEILESQNYLKIMKEKHVSSLVAKVMDFRENISTEMVGLHSFNLFKDSKKVLERIEKAIVNQEKIVVYGDYDCDGMMATTILVSAFEKRGVKVGYHIPNRFIDGYGLNVSRVEEIADKGYKLIITVDNGISALEACKRAKELGVDVIITDHHELPPILPDAYAIIHTALSPDYPFKAISGGFVACKLACALIGKQDAYLHCLAALTTISDVMPMIDENRTLVKGALRLLERNKYLSFELLAGENTKYTTTTLGFIIAPKINAIGRLQDGLSPNQCITYFKHSGATSEKERMFKLAFVTSCNKLNQERQKLTNEQYKIAKSMIKQDIDALCCVDANFHEGLIGLVAGKLTKEYYRPSFIMHENEDTGLIKGSARSIKGIHLYDLLQANANVLKSYGGHALAGGFSLQKENYNEFVEGINKFIKQNKDEKTFIETKDSILVEETDLNLSNLHEFESLAPFGHGNEEPTFHLVLQQPSKIETLSNNKHLKLTFNLRSGSFNCLWFNHGKDYESIKHLNQFHLFGQLSINEFRNIETMQMILEDLY